jgi:hypothetical protein
MGILDKDFSKAIASMEAAELRGKIMKDKPKDWTWFILAAIIIAWILFSTQNL